MCKTTVKKCAECPILCSVPNMQNLKDVPKMCKNVQLMHTMAPRCKICPMEFAYGFRACGWPWLEPELPCRHDAFSPLRFSRFHHKTHFSRKFSPDPPLLAPISVNTALRKPLTYPSTHKTPLCVSWHTLKSHVGERERAPFVGKTYKHWGKKYIAPAGLHTSLASQTQPQPLLIGSRLGRLLWLSLCPGRATATVRARPSSWAAGLHRHITANGLKGDTHSDAAHAGGPQYAWFIPLVAHHWLHHCLHHSALQGIAAAPAAAPRSRPRVPPAATRPVLPSPPPSAPPRPLVWGRGRGERGRE